MTRVTAPQNSDSLPDYTLLETIYQGVRTIVYRAVEVATQRPVVIKVLAQEYPNFAELAQFCNQYTVASQLPITGVVRPIKLVSWANSRALVMEAFEGLDLGQYMQQTPLDLTEILNIALQLADILQALQQHRVIHKDIKPANILIHPESKQVKLIDFSIASLLPKETQSIQSPRNLEGTLAYIAPEQTGRMNRAIDYRTDFYALGVTLYQLLTGQLPFAAEDPLELIHCHIAQRPTAVHQVNPQIPAMVAAIVDKLMAKNAEDRYQNPLGLKADLETCLEQWTAQGAIAAFKLGQQDRNDRFIIPEKLYGRAAEVQTVLDAFERVMQGRSELLLVAGFSGIGKTAVVNEVHKPIVRQRGYFIRGKFDQFNRNIPFSAFVQALRDLVGQLLGESDAELAVWKTQILDALGENAQVMIELIPALEGLLGPQPPAPTLSGAAAQNRFNLVFQKFIQVFATATHPLVIFVDDLQWADTASLNLVKLLMVDAQSQHLLLLGAYRDNEIFPAHPLVLTLDEIAQAQAGLCTVTLSPLDVDSLNELVAETLQVAPAVAQPLTALVMQKTQGNPFFATQFLNALYQDQLITFDPAMGHWQCDLAQVQDAAVTDDVVELMAQRLKQLPDDTQQILKLAACVGAQFTLEILSLVCEQSCSEIANHLWPALQTGLIIPQSDVYKFYLGEAPVNAAMTADSNQGVAQYRFLHDRVQQAAHALIPDAEKAAIHCQIGQHLLANLTPETQGEMLFTIVGQLNQGQALLSSEVDRAQLTALNLEAGRKAKRATAYGAAAEYLTVARQALSSDSWQSNYATTLNVYTETIEVDYLNSNFAAVEQLSTQILDQTQALLDVVKVYEVIIRTWVARGDQHRALATGLGCLKQLGILLRQEKPAAVKAVSTLLDAPAMTAPDKLAAMGIMAHIVTPAWSVNPELFRQITFTLVDLSLQYGNCGASAFGYAWYGSILCQTLENIDEGYAFGQLSVALLERFNAQEFRAKVLNLNASCIRFWKEHLRASFPVHQAGIQQGLETGDLEFASYCAVEYCYYLFLVGEPLSDLQRLAQQNLAMVDHLNQAFHVDYLAPLLQGTSNLVGVSQTFSPLEGEIYSETHRLPILVEEQQLTTVFVAYFVKSILSYLNGDVVNALAHVDCAHEHSAGVAGTFLIPAELFYASLIRIAMLPQMTPSQQQHALETVDDSLTQLKRWAEAAPMNYQHKCDLVEAELAQYEGQFAVAMDLYDRAIAGAETHGFKSEAALANERAAMFYQDWGKVKIAQVYLQAAYYGYSRWGAQAKTVDLAARYPELLAPILQPSALSNDVFTTLMTVTPSTMVSRGVTQSYSASRHDSRQWSSQPLDFASVLKAAQAISGTIELEALQRQLAQIILQNSGGDRCSLVLPDETETWHVQAIATTDDVQLCMQPLESCTNLPVQLVQYVKNTQEVVVIDQLETDLPVLDHYLHERQPQSVLGLPILNQCRCLGVLVVENHLTRGVFGDEGILVLNFLCAQAAISLNNARLYEQQQQQTLQLKLSEQWHKTIYENASDAIMLLAPQGFIDCNQACVDLLGLANREAIVALHPSEISPVNQPDGQPSFEKANAMIQAAHKYGTHKFEWMHQRCSGEPFWAEVVLTPIVYTDPMNQMIDCLHAIVRDISDRKQAEAMTIQKSQALEQTLTELKSAQLQLVQSEKMSALGGLVAGVAHEINNPVGCILGNVGATQDYIADLLGLIDCYAEQYPEPGTAIEDEIEAIDLEFLREDLPDLMRAMKDSGARIKSISQSLRTFSRSDADTKQSFDIREGIDSTILILRHRLKANDHRPEITVERNYGELAEIKCFPGQVNQVLMNILANAIDALDESSQQSNWSENTARAPHIKIQTTCQDQQVQITIADNGPGIPEEIRTKIFDHLFTTKDVGKGTGLGLAIAQQIIVETHGGTLDVRSSVGQGTDFCISLPLV